jgi:DNA-binding CsgD family transcriptional regulator
MGHVTPSPSSKPEAEPKRNASFGNRSEDALQVLSSQNAVLRGSLNALTNAIVLVNRNRQVIFLNAAAECLVERCRELCIRAGRLCAADDGNTVRLEQLTQRATGGDGKEPLGGAVVLRRGRGKQPLHIMGVPIPIDSQTTLMVGHGPVAMLVIDDPDQRPYVPHEIIAALFGLTPSEARLLLALSQGQTLTQYTVELHVTQNTARTHLKSIFAKTKTSRQSDLVRLMNGITHSVTWS